MSKETLDAWKDDLAKRLEEHLEQNPEKPVLQEEQGDVVGIWIEKIPFIKILGMDPETVRKQFEADGWELIFSAPKGMAVNMKRPDLRHGEKLFMVLTQERRMIFLRKEPPAGMGHSRYSYE